LDKRRCLTLSVERSSTLASPSKSPFPKRIDGKAEPAVSTFRYRDLMVRD
jgi:hypothetical protein